jgi:hypothetical protein
LNKSKSLRRSKWKIELEMNYGNLVPLHP